MYKLCKCKSNMLLHEVVITQQLFRSLMAEGKKEFFSLEVLLNIQPEGSSENSLCWEWGH